VSTTISSLRELAGRYSTTKLRTIAAAFELFAKHGVGGTSLQMIADEVGVTKAAVYHQFATKDAIVLATLEVQLQPVEELLERAEAAKPSRKRREDLLAELIDLVVSNRRSLSTLQSDPVLFRMLAEYPPSIAMWSRLFALLLDDRVDERAQVRAGVLAAALGSVAYPFVMDLDNEVLRDELHLLTRHLVFNAR
jgi:AcrR family transcriptional regulator